MLAAPHRGVQEPLTRVVLSTAPLADHPDYASLPPGPALVHFDGWHRLVAWALAGRLDEAARADAHVADCAGIAVSGHRSRDVGTIPVNRVIMRHSRGARWAPTASTMTARHPPPPWAEALQSLMRERGLTQVQLARLSGLDAGRWPTSSTAAIAAR